MDDLADLRAVINADLGPVVELAPLDPAREAEFEALLADSEAAHAEAIAGLDSLPAG